MAVDTPDQDVYDVRAAMGRLAALIITETEVMLREASPAIKQRLLTSMFGKMLPLLDADDNEGTDDLRRMMMDLFAEVKTTTGGSTSASETPTDIEEDAP